MDTPVEGGRTSLNKHDLAAWFQQHKDTASLLCRANRSVQEAWPLAIKQTAFPAVFRPSAQGADTPADID
ncbi:hypothetical protein [Shouchella lonarensis]|uniref:Uncharacterized protein n=1 Tax=Shouchella lonarensis TaxID=1464122 RepID=A0A1G6HAM6_9BACI|nr:hypothetical protein [Shouchella lonarensis]SDB91194.1 hypothetical protein SAMN05421737_103114 [Shouchella lonarensis]